jgi:hypothetical protein
MTYKYHGNIKCDCGEKQEQHYNGEGACKVNGCTWFHPRIEYIAKKQGKTLAQLKREIQNKF